MNLLRTKSLLTQYKEAIDQSSILSKTNKYGKITYANEEFCRLSKYSLEELIGKSHNIVRHPDSPESLFSNLWTTIKAGKIWKGIIKNRAKDGESYTTKATIIPILNFAGQIEEFISIRTDITELLSLQTELHLQVEQKTTELKKAFEGMKEDLLLAKKIQLSTLPTNLESCKDFIVASEYLPMNEVGGDFYSFDELSYGKYRIFLADASGHGIQAALVTMAIKGIYDNLKRFELDLSHILKIFNSEYLRLYRSLKTYFTCVLIEIDYPNKKFTYTAAGHHSSVLLNKKSMILLPRTGPILGVKDNVQYTQIQGNITKKDKLFLFTDGIFEQFVNEDMFGEERFHKFLADNFEYPVKTILEKSLSELRNFLGNTKSQDDIALLGIQF